MPKYELEITQADIQALREVLADTLDGTESDEDIVRECFYVTGYGTKADLRNKVKIKEMANSARKAQKK